MGTWTNPLPLQGFSGKALLFWCEDHKRTPGRLLKSYEEELSFFSCNAGLVLDMVGQLLEMVKTVVNLPGNETKTKQQHPHNKATKTTQTATPTKSPATSRKNSQGDL